LITKSLRHLLHFDAAAPAIVATSSGVKASFAALSAPVSRDLNRLALTMSSSLVTTISETEGADDPRPAVVPSTLNITSCARGSPGGVVAITAIPMARAKCPATRVLGELGLNMTADPHPAVRAVGLAGKPTGNPAGALPSR
jgi:hypothetical protein